MNDVDSALWVVLALVALIALVAIRERVGAGRAQAERAMARDLSMRLGRRGPWVGVWLVAIPWSRRARVMDEGANLAARRMPAGEILRLWAREGARLVTHLAGPEVSTEEEASGWLSEMSDKLEGEPIPNARLPAGEAIFAMLYGCGKPPALGGSTVLVAGHAVLDADCFGVAFVRCPAGRRLALSNRVGAASQAAFAGIAAGLLVLAARPTFLARPLVPERSCDCATCAACPEVAGPPSRARDAPATTAATTGFAEPGSTGAGDAGTALSTAERAAATTAEADASGSISGTAAPDSSGSLAEAPRSGAASSSMAPNGGASGAGSGKARDPATRKQEKKPSDAGAPVNKRSSRPPDQDDQAQ